MRSSGWASRSAGRLAEAGTAGIRVVLYGATVSGGEPAPLEDHDELRWLSPDEIDSVGWLPIDLALLPAARRHLQERNRRGRL